MFVSAAIIADTVVGSTAPDIRIRVPLVNSISTTLPTDGAGDAGVGLAASSDSAGAAGAIITAENVGALSAALCDDHLFQRRVIQLASTVLSHLPSENQTRFALSIKMCNYLWID